MKAIDLTQAEIKVLEQRRSALGAMDCDIAKKNRLITGIKDHKGVEYGMTQFGSYQVLFTKGYQSFPIELTGTFTDPRQIVRLVDSLVAEGKLIESE
ncbi:hypothetical protein ACI77I_14920 [Pseudomonas sp. D47]|uniref:hypothetical protein n=1 Tax=Pseudomonas sp. D47 TaxID=3159447 RepID=UPI00387B47F1